MAKMLVLSQMKETLYGKYWNEYERPVYIVGDFETLCFQKPTTKNYYAALRAEKKLEKGNLDNRWERNRNHTKLSSFRFLAHCLSYHMAALSRIFICGYYYRDATFLLYVVTDFTPEAHLYCMHISPNHLLISLPSFFQGQNKLEIVILFIRNWALCGSNRIQSKS